MMETRINLFKKLTIGVLTLLANSRRALSSCFSDVFTTSDFAGDAGRSEVADFYVAPNGKDSNPGTAMAPFATLAGARNAVRKKISNGLTHNLLVLIRDGTYAQTETLTFGPEDSGTDKYSITYAASSGEKVVVSGGEKIVGWRKGPSAIWTTEVPGVKAGQSYFRQLFINGKRATRARTPNADDKAPLNWR